jgi:tRNA threonylcarbamoyladenosine biosynthesis protein TsaE
MKKIEYNLDQIDIIAKKFAADITDKKIVTFVGGLGAGKTTFIKSVLHAMGVEGHIISPTFTYFNQYQASDGRIIYHFDLYRLKNFAEFEAAGFFEYLYQPNSIAFIEWPEILDGSFKDFVCRAKLSVLDHQRRLLEYDC